MKHALAFATAAALSFVFGLPWLTATLALIAITLFLVWVFKAGFNLFDDAAGNEDTSETFDEELSTLRRQIFDWAVGIVENLPRPLNWLIGGAYGVLMIVFYYGPCWLFLKGVRKCGAFAERKGGKLYNYHQKTLLWLEDIVEYPD